MNPRTLETAHDEHHASPVSQPVARDADLPTISDTTLCFFAAGSLVVFLVALLTLIH
jgi:hypothetical protein